MAAAVQHNACSKSANAATARSPDFDQMNRRLPGQLFLVTSLTRRSHDTKAQAWCFGQRLLGRYAARETTQALVVQSCMDTVLEIQPDKLKLFSFLGGLHSLGSELYIPK